MRQRDPDLVQEAGLDPNLDQAGLAEALDDSQALPDPVPAPTAASACIDDADAGRTVAGEALGTPWYMSPEQAEGNLEEVDESSPPHEGLPYGGRAVGEMTAWGAVVIASAISNATGASVGIQKGLFGRFRLQSRRYRPIEYLRPFVFCTSMKGT